MPPKRNPETIFSCETCPNFKKPWFGPNYCAKEGRIPEKIRRVFPGGFFSWAYIIPKWCPLPDEK